MLIINRNIEIKAFSYTTFHDVGMFLIFRNHSAEALQWFQYFSENYPESAKAKYLLAVTYRRLGKMDDGIKYLNMAKQLMDEDIFLSVGQKRTYQERIDRMLK